jgi:hypothetical protein
MNKPPEKPASAPVARSDVNDADVGIAVHEAAEPKRQRFPSRRSPRLFDTIESAAAKLDLDVEALRARCRRAATRVGDTVQAHLGGGIVAFKFGRSWRIRFPPT